MNKIFRQAKNMFTVVLRNYLRITKILWKEQRKLLFFSYLYNMVVSIIPIINAFIYGYVVDIIIESVNTHKNVAMPLVILIILWFIFYYISSYVSSYYIVIYQRMRIFFGKYYTQLFLEKLNNIDIQTLYDKDFHDYFNKAEERYDYIGSNIAADLFQLNTALLKFIFSLVVFFYFSPLIAFIILLSFIPSIVYSIHYSRMSWGIWSESVEYRKKFFSILNIFRRDNTQELKIHQSGNYLKDQVISLNNEMYDKEINLSRQRNRFNIIGALIESAIYIISVVYIIFEAIKKIIPIGLIVTFLSILGNYISSVESLSDYIASIYTNSLYFDDLYRYLEFELENKMENGTIKVKNTIQHKIEFKNVYFKYPKTKRYVFENLSLIINPGEKIAIIGENGAGKSTFINLLCRFFDVDKGEVLIDGVNIKKIDIYSWYDCIGVLFQDYINYEFSVKENIQLGRIENKKNNIDVIINASKKANASGFINKLEDKYDTVLSKQDINISGGQWQKLALAREFFRDPDILILDEPTSNLDPKSERKIFDIIEKTEKSKSIILISHRYSTIRHVDNILVFEKGKILEEGSHKELMKQKGKYFELFTVQAKSYQE